MLNFFFWRKRPPPIERTGRTVSFLEQYWGHALHMVDRKIGDRKTFTAMCHCTPRPVVGDAIEFWWTNPKAKLTTEELNRGRRLGQVARGVFTMVRGCGNPKDMYRSEFVVEEIDPPYTPSKETP